MLTLDQFDNSLCGDSINPNICWISFVFSNIFLVNEKKPCQQCSQESIGGCRNPRQRDRLFPPYPCMISTPCLPVRKVLCKDSLILLKFRFKRNGKTWIFQHYLFSLTTLVYFRKSLSRVVCESVMFVVISNQTFWSCFPKTISSPSNRRDKRS